MDIVLLLKSGAGLLVLLAILVYLMISVPKAKAKAKAEAEAKKNSKVASVDTKINIDFNHLRAIIRNKKSTSKELKEALDLILKYHGTIHPKLGARAHQDFDMYMDVIMHICRHPNTNKNLILKFDKELVSKNPEYKVDINDSLTKGLNSRGF